MVVEELLKGKETRLEDGISFKDKDEWELCPKYNIGNSSKD